MAGTGLAARVAVDGSITGKLGPPVPAAPERFGLPSGPHVNAEVPAAPEMKTPPVPAPPGTKEPSPAPPVVNGFPSFGLPAAPATPEVCVGAGYTCRSAAGGAHATKPAKTPAIPIPIKRTTLLLMDEL